MSRNKQGRKPSWRPTRTTSPTSIASTTGTCRDTESEGRITLSRLIPGARYRIIDFSTVNDQDKGVQVRKDFTVKSGEAARPGRYPDREAVVITSVRGEAKATRSSK